MELLNDNCCLTCSFSTLQKVDEFGNPEHLICSLLDEDVSTDDICEDFE